MAGKEKTMMVRVKHYPNFGKVELKPHGKDAIVISRERYMELINHVEVTNRNEWRYKKKC